MSLIDGIKSKFNVGAVNPYTSSRTAGVSAGGGEVESTGNGWEKFHTGQGPNGLHGGFLADGTGEGGAHRLNMYM